MRRPHSADDFAAIRARIAELRRERTQPLGDDAQSATEPSPEPDRSAPALKIRPGIPGWRVSRRKRFSQT
jgi:hypothetical protein